MLKKISLLIILILALQTKGIAAAAADAVGFPVDAVTIHNNGQFLTYRGVTYTPQTAGNPVHQAPVNQESATFERLLGGASKGIGYTFCASVVTYAGMAVVSRQVDSNCFISHTTKGVFALSALSGLFTFLFNQDKAKWLGWTLGTGTIAAFLFSFSPTLNNNLKLG
jgi:hypothetical protein